MKDSGYLAPEEEVAAFIDTHETGEEAFWVETYHFESDGAEHIEAHVHVLCNGSDERHNEQFEQLGNNADRGRRIHYSDAHVLPASILMNPKCASALKISSSPDKTKLATRHTRASLTSGRSRACAA